MVRAEHLAWRRALPFLCLLKLYKNKHIFYFSTALVSIRKHKVCFCPLPAPAHRKVGTTPCMNNTPELTLLAGVQVSLGYGYESRRALLPLPSCTIGRQRQEKYTLPCPHNATCDRQESWPGGCENRLAGSISAAIWRVGPVPHLGERVELALVV